MFGTLLRQTSTTLGSSLLLFSPFTEDFDYERELRESCCGIAGQCITMYYTRRPNDACDRYRPSKGGTLPKVNTIPDIVNAQENQ